MLKAKRNAILDAETGEQMAVVLPSSCGRRDAERWAQYVVDRVNADARSKAFRERHAQGKEVKP